MQTQKLEDSQLEKARNLFRELESARNDEKPEEIARRNLRTQERISEIKN